MIINLHEVYETEGGMELICYEQTEKYSFLCPFTMKEDDESLVLDISKTFVYSNKVIENIEENTAIETLILT